MLAGNWRMVTAAHLRESAELDAVLPAWKRLADHSLAPAGLNAPELVMPLLRGLPGAELAVVKQGNDLLFALPVRRWRYLPRLLSNWMTALTIIGEPHLDREFPEVALTSFINHLKYPIVLHSIEVNGPFWNVLAKQDAQVSILATWQRAALHLAGTYESWAESNFGAKRRREYRRLTNRLSDLGKLEFLSLETGRDYRPWATELLALEAAGWKGKRGTAMAADLGLSAAFKEACQFLGVAGKLRFWKLALDGRPIAMMYAIVEGDRAWLHKMTYNEDYAKFSPGILVALFAIERLYAEGGVRLVDSCAIPGHQMMESFLRDRLHMADVMLAPHSVGSRRFDFARSAEIGRRAARSFARDIYYRLRGKKRS
jgi:CelD/BcsL family acetyltransferase involved in cellulose biosynthesis